MMKIISRWTAIVFSFLLLAGESQVRAQEQSVIRQWNASLLGAISRDLARPPVHARNLFHSSAAMYDAWAAYEPGAEPFLLGRVKGSYTCSFDGVVSSTIVAERVAAQEEAICFAAYRMQLHRFADSPGFATTLSLANAFMDSRGLDRTNTSVDYQSGGPAELGNYVAQQYIAYGLSDGANEADNYVHQYYSPSNAPIEVEQPGNPSITDPNLWQQISLSNAIDQSGNPVFGVPAPIGHEWGNVVPFALTDDDMVERVRNFGTYKVYMDPGPPAWIDTTVAEGLEMYYKWSFIMVAIWQSHLDPDDTTMWDISPASQGNVQSYPTDEQGIRAFYNYFDGGDTGQGRAVNPVTGQAYEPQWVKRGDYTRILAEYWADGPQSVTPPGHWHDIMHQVMDHPLFERRWMGQGDVLSALEYDAKAHLAMSGAMHDAAITAWSIKGWYDYIRPVSAIRYMGDMGQCSDPLFPNYHPAGLPIIPGYIEQVDDLDPLRGPQGEHIGKMKLFTWRGPEFIGDPLTEHAGVSWILVENWWPYQRPSFVTPPFSGYISGHSTYSSTAAQIMEEITGNAFFPGGMSNFYAPQNDFLLFENGPSEDVHLQWATYRDAADQCSLSRIWGGIHPPVDDMVGRRIGVELGDRAVEMANMIFDADRPIVEQVVASQEAIAIADIGNSVSLNIVYDRDMDTDSDPEFEFIVDDPLAEALLLTAASWTSERIYTLEFEVLGSELRLENIRLRLAEAISLEGQVQNVSLHGRPFVIDTDRPMVASVVSSSSLLNSDVAISGSVEVVISFSEACDPSSQLAIALSGTSDPNASIQYDAATSSWLDDTLFIARFLVSDTNEEIEEVSLAVSGVFDLLGNEQSAHLPTAFLTIDTREPELLSATVSSTVLGLQDLGSSALQITFEFDENMETSVQPTLSFPVDDPMLASLLLEAANSSWLDARSYRISYTLLNANEELDDISVSLSGFMDTQGNSYGNGPLEELFRIDTQRPLVQTLVPSTMVVADAHVGPQGFTVDVVFAEDMNTGQLALVQLSGSSQLSSSFSANIPASSWVGSNTFRAAFDVTDQNIELESLAVNVSFARDLAGNTMSTLVSDPIFSLDTKNPELLSLTANTYALTNTSVGPGGFSLLSVFNEPMDEAVAPLAAFSPELEDILSLDDAGSDWISPSTYRMLFDVASIDADLPSVAVALSGARDRAGNSAELVGFDPFLSIDLQAVGIDEALLSDGVLLFPNPTVSGQTMFLRLDGALDEVGIQVFNGLGAVVYQTPASHMEPGIHKVDLPALAPGVHQLLLSVGNTSHARTFVVLQD